MNRYRQNKQSTFLNIFLITLNGIRRENDNREADGLKRFEQAKLLGVDMCSNATLFICWLWSSISRAETPPNSHTSRYSHALLAIEIKFTYSASTKVCTCFHLFQWATRAVILFRGCCVAEKKTLFKHLLMFSQQQETHEISRLKYNPAGDPEAVSAIRTDSNKIR